MTDGIRREKPRASDTRELDALMQRQQTTNTDITDIRERLAGLEEKTKHLLTKSEFWRTLLVAILGLPASIFALYKLSVWDLIK